MLGKDCYIATLFLASGPPQSVGDQRAVPSGEVAELAEGTGLLNLRRGNSTEGSNPSLSAFLRPVEP